MNCPLRYALALLAALQLIGARSQETRWSVRHFDVSNGLPQSSVMDMAVDTLGFLWLTTEGGLVRYDGRSFVMTRTVPGDDHLTTRTRQLLVTPDNELFVDDANGDVYAVHGHSIAMRIHGSGRRFQVRGNIPSMAVYLAITDTAHGHLFSEDGQLAGLNVVALDTARWLLRMGARILVYEGGRRIKEVPSPSRTRSIFLLAGKVMTWDDQGRLLRSDEAMGSWKPVDVLVNGTVSAWPKGGRLLLCKHDREAFLSLAGKLMRCTSGADGRVRLDDLGIQLPEGTVVNSATRIGDTGIIAVGTSSKGLYLYRQDLLTTVKCNVGGEQENSFYAQADLGQAGILTVGSGRTGFVFGPEGCRPFEAIPAGLSYAALCTDAKGTIWFSREELLYGYSPRERTVTAVEGTEVWHPTMWAEGDSMWIADLKRIGYKKGERITWTAQLGGTQHLDRPFVIRRLPGGLLVFGSCRGLFIATSAAATAFRPDPRFDGLCVRSIEVIEDLVVIGTYGAGIRVLRNDSLFELPVDRLEALNHVHASVLDGDKNLWMSTNKGLVRTTLADIRTYLADVQQRPFYAVYGASAGMTNPELNGGCEPAWLRLADGRLSFPTMDGLVQFDPTAIPDPFPTHPVLIGDVQVNGRSWPVDAYSIFPPNTLKVSIELAMAYWGEPENAKLEYRITGISEEWAPLKLDQGRLVIDRPPTGVHEVYVRAVGSAARGIQAEALYWFRVETSFWWTWNGLLLIALGMLAFVTLVWQVYTHRLRRRNRWLEENVQLRTKELDDRNDQLTRALETRSALIATIGHDIITPLRFIARVARSTRQLNRTGVEPAELDRSLEDLGQSAEKLNANASALMDWVKFNPDQITPRLRTVDLGALVREAVELWQELADRSNISIEAHVGPDIMVRSDPHLLKVILNNLLGNAITHSGKDISVRITFAKQREGWELRMADTGAGIDADTLERLQQLLNTPHMSDPARFARGDGQGIGYVIVASMAQLLRASIRIHSNTAGTVITLHNPEA